MTNQLAILHGGPEGNKITLLTQKRINHQNKIRYVGVEIKKTPYSKLFHNQISTIYLNRAPEIYTIYQANVGVS